MIFYLNVAKINAQPFGLILRKATKSCLNLVLRKSRSSAQIVSRKADFLLKYAE